MDMDNIMEKIEDIKNRLNQLNKELNNTSIEASDRENLVTAVVNGKGMVMDYQFNVELVTSISKNEFVSAVVQATNNALEKAKKLETTRKKDIIGEVNIPDMPGLF